MDKSENIVSLIEKYLNNDCNPEELARMIQLFQSDEHKEQLRMLLFEYWQHSPSNRHKIMEDELSQMLDSIHHQINLEQKAKQPILRKLYQYAQRAAAILFIPLLLASVWMFYQNTNYATSGQYITLETPMGSKLKTVLPDGTEVWQNGGTTLQYPTKFTKKNREVILTGEAYFHVSSDKKHPFEVKTTDGTITVTGTRFNVSAFANDDYSSVVLEEGKVYFTPANNEEMEIELVPTEQLIYQKESGSLTKQIVDVDKYTAWTEGKLIFRNDPLEEVITRLSRWYNTAIELKDPTGKLGKHPFTMTIQNETLPQVLEYLSNAAGFRLEQYTISPQQSSSMTRTKYVISRHN